MRRLSPLLSLLLACSPKPQGADDTGTTPTAIPGTSVHGDAARVTTPSTADVPQLASENADFAVDVTRQLLAGATDDLVMSPWSLQSVMAQVYAGASGDGKTAIASTFRWTLPDAQLHEAMDASALMIEARHAPSGEPPLLLTNISQIFVTTGYPLGATWLDTLSAYYGTGVQTMDFAADPSGVASDINAWIASNTGDRIKDLITAQMVGDSRMLLVNALYLKASWYVPFSEGATSDDDFTLLDGTTVSVPTMSGSVRVAGAEGDGYFVAELPFSDANLVMTIVLPDAGRFTELAESLEWADIEATLAETSGCDECAVSMPKFEIKSSPDVQAAMTAMGMGPAFGGSYPDINPDLTLTGVDQQAFVLVNEIGTEAAAATVAEFSDSASKPPFGPIELNRPFLFFLRDQESGAILFTGALLDPR